MTKWNETPKYIQIVDCGKLGFAIWDFPHTATFYPTHEQTFDDAVRAAFDNDYVPVCAYGHRLIMKNTQV